jgi:cell division protein ZipA
MDILDWLVIATIIAIVLVLVDGFRRKWVERRDRVVMKLDRHLPLEDIDLDQLPNSELPNGGARTVARQSEPPSLSLRKRHFGLKDGRDRTRTELAVTQTSPVPVEAEAAVPVLMDPVLVAEDTIQHANVFVQPEPELAISLAFVREEAPPAGAAEAEEVRDEIHDELLDGEEEADLDPIDRVVQRQRAQDAAGKPSSARDTADDDDFELPADGYEEDADPGLDGDLDEAGDDSAPSAFAEQDSAAAPRDEDDEQSAADADESDNFEDDSGTNEGAADHYEDEPALLENAYKIATSRFQRPAPVVLPRLEPGFGEGPEDEVAPAELFATALDESVFTEILDAEQEEIRAWRVQSVTQQQAPQPAAPAVAPAPPLTVFVETRSEEEVVASAPAGVMPAVAPFVASAPAVPAATTSAVVTEPSAIELLAEEAPVCEPTAPPSFAEEPSTTEPLATEPESGEPLSLEPLMAEPLTAEPRRVGAKPEAAKTPKAGFWETFTGKSAKKSVPKSAPEAAPSINQGELFQEPAVEVDDAPVDMPAGPREVIIINVMAKPGYHFFGEDLLPVLQYCGLRLGSMNIFHRHADADGHGPVMFSMANIVKPGTFSLGAMQEFSTPGLSFFLQLPNPHGNMKAFEQMLATANTIRQALEGDLKDEQRSVFTRQTMEHCRQRIRDFELLMLARK